MHRLWSTTAALVWCLFTVPAAAHGGGLNKDGCHNDRKSGGYHCHRSPTVAPSVVSSTNAAAADPIKSSRAASQVPRDSGARPTCYTGPKGGTYTITKSGKKNYAGC